MCACGCSSRIHTKSSKGIITGSRRIHSRVDEISQHITALDGVEDRWGRGVNLSAQDGGGVVERGS